LTEAGELFTFGFGGHGRLGHAGTQHEPVPRLVKAALVGKKVVGAAGGSQHTAAWTDAGELFTFGLGQCGQLGHGGPGGGRAYPKGGRIPRLVEALAEA